jgi:hypothetical protein
MARIAHLLAGIRSGPLGYGLLHGGQDAGRYVLIFISTPLPFKRKKSRTLEA